MSAEDTEARILICYDGSAEAERALETAAAVFPSGRAVVLAVAPTMTFAEGMAATSAIVPGGAFDDLNKADAQRTAEAGAEHARRAGLRAEARASIASSTGRGIVDVADEIDASVIVIGSRALKGPREFAEGSVSHDVATHAGRPVLIVPPPREAA